VLSKTIIGEAGERKEGEKKALFDFLLIAIVVANNSRIFFYKYIILN
jgi:hypothetical protein